MPRQNQPGNYMQHSDYLMSAQTFVNIFTSAEKTPHAPLTKTIGSKHKVGKNEQFQ